MGNYTIQFKAVRGDACQEHWRSRTRPVGSRGLQPRKDKDFDEPLYVLADPHALGCGCRPSVVIGAVRAVAGLSQEQRDELVQQAFRLIGQ